MTYDNPYGGKWVWDEANPFNVNLPEGFLVLHELTPKL